MDDLELTDNMALDHDREVFEMGLPGIRDYHDDFSRIAIDNEIESW